MGKEYVITTKNGCVHYVTDTSARCFQKYWKVMLDDFLFVDSFYHRGGTCNLQKYIGSEQPIILGYKAKPKVLTSKRGQYKLTENKFIEVKQQMEIENSYDLSTGKLYYNEEEVYEPSDLSDFNSCTYKVVGTSFINELIDNAMLLFENEGNLIAKHLNETEFEYQKYTLSINEITTFTFIAEHNYNVFYNYMNKIDADL